MLEQIVDIAGNELYCDDKTRAVFLRLAGRDEIRRLGFIRGRTFYTKRKRSNTMRTLNELGFSSLLISRGNFDLVRVQLSDGRELEIEREKILEIGTWKNFVSQGFELQVFVPVTAFTEVPADPTKKKPARRRAAAPGQQNRVYHPA
jgi:hypothetical protein